MKAIAMRLIHIVLVLPAIFATTAVRAQDYTTRPITVIMPFAGGSASDVATRIMVDAHEQIDGPADDGRQPTGRRRQYGTPRRPRPRPTATLWSAPAPAPSPPT